MSKKAEKKVKPAPFADVVKKAAAGEATTLEFDTRPESLTASYRLWAARRRHKLQTKIVIVATEGKTKPFGVIVRPADRKD